MYPECGIVVFQGRRPRNSIILHEGYNPYTLENHSTADLYYDATTQTLGSVSLPQSLYFTMQLECIFIHPRVYEIFRVHGFCNSCFSFEVWLHHYSTSYDVPKFRYRGQHTYRVPKFRYHVWTTKEQCMD